MTTYILAADSSRRLGILEKLIEEDTLGNPITFNKESGRLEDNFLNQRVIVLDEEFYRGIRNKLYSSFQSGASVILYDMGLGYGELMGKSIEKMGSYQLKIMNDFMSLGKRRGYGTFHTPLLKLILSGIQGEPVVRLRDSFFSTCVGDTGKTECYMMAGIIAGAAKVVLKKDNLVCIEEKCLSKGDSYCEFKITRPKKNDPEF
jgi:predicted hydrocarbon binding protein